jgi:hypothetical protein
MTQIINKQRYLTDSRGVEYDAGCGFLGDGGVVFQVLAKDADGNVIVDESGIPVSWDDPATVAAYRAYIAEQK